MRERDSWFIKIADAANPDHFGLGEVGPLPGLSPELDESFEEKLTEFVEQFNGQKLNLNDSGGNSEAFVKSVTDRITGLLNYSSILFGFETALLDLIHGGDRTIFKNKFTQGQAVPINGLIWMSGMDLTLQQIEIKIQEGFTCLKLKVGGIDFEKECDILQYIRRKYFKMDITIRLDANEAFKSEEVMYKLHELSKFDIQSIEQPLKVGSPMLPELCAKSPIPIALDEELIGKNSSDEKKALLASANPHFIILKPSLHGGFSGCRDWISTAEELKIGWWMTSALESSVGLNAIAQFTAEYNNQLPQGLGTGKIYDDNFESPLSVKNGSLSYSAASSWTLPEFD